MATNLGSGLAVHAMKRRVVSMKNINDKKNLEGMNNAGLIIQTNQQAENRIG
jgi:hypothetical protein